MRNSVEVTVAGNLTGRPELKFTPTGTAMCKFTVAVNPRTYDKAAGEWKDGEPSFYRCTAWQQLAENLAESLDKGHRILVVGELKQRSWKDETSGDLKSAWEVTVTEAGPALTWATARVQKMARGSRDETAPDDPWATASRERVPAGASDEPPL
jgi:single-strand DNA-binding protein